MVPIQIAPSALAAMREAADAAAPAECCGLMFGRDGLIDRIRKTRNVHPTPETHFEIDPQALVDAHRAARSGGPEVIGYFHSHPSGPAGPSVTDQAMAHGDGKVWAIVGRGQITFWCDEPDGFRQLDFS